MAKKKISKRRQMRLIIFGLPSLFFIFYFCFTLLNYVYSYSSLKTEEKVLTNNLLTLQEEKHNLKVEIQKLNDPSYVIRYAKEKFLYSGNGEYVIKLNEDTKLEQLNIVADKNNNIIIISAIGIILAVLVIIRLTKKSN